MKTKKIISLEFLCLLWGFYALSRTITIFAEGALGAFGNQWLVTEAVFSLLASLLLFANRRSVSAQTSH